MNRCLLTAAIGAALATPVYAEVTIDWLHIEAVESSLAIMEQAAREYEAMHPDVTINMQFLENEAFKAKLTTLLQSDAAPDIFYSWGGGVLSAQQDAGVLRTIGSVVTDETRANIGAGGINAFTRDGELYGLAQQVSQVGFWANAELLDQAGVSESDFETWEGFIGAVEKLQAADITPIALGAQDKWPAHFYWSYLVMRLAGQEGFDAGRAGDNGGFTNEAFVKAGDMFLELAALEPFQDGYLAADYTTAAGVFGDGKAALHLMGDWDYAVSRDNSESGNGIADENLRFINFPGVDGGAGEATDTLGGINGWIFHRDAPDEAVEFMQWYETAEVQRRFAEAATYIPIVAGSADALSNPFQREASQNVSNTGWHAIFFDQELGADVGGVVNDISLELSANDISGQEAAEIVEEALEDSR